MINAFIELTTDENIKKQKDKIKKLKAETKKADDMMDKYVRAHILTIPSIEMPEIEGDK